MHGQTGDIGAAHLHLAGVDTHADLDPEHPHGVDDRVRARDGRTRAGKGGDETVPGSVDFATAEPVELTSDDGVVVVEQVSPPAVAERRSVLSGSGDVGEHDRGEYPLGVEAAPHPGDEFLDL